MAPKLRGDVVLIPNLPFPAWRLLIDYLWGDAAFMYFVVPRFLTAGPVAVVLLGNGGPTGQAAATRGKAIGRNSQ